MDDDNGGQKVKRKVEHIWQDRRNHAKLPRSTENYERNVKSNGYILSQMMVQTESNVVTIHLKT